MTPDLTKEEQIARGEHAKRLLDDPLFQEALATVRQTIMETWAKLPLANKEQAEDLKRCLWASNQFEAIFETLIAGATVARHELLLETNMQTKRDAAKGNLYGT